MAGQEFVVATLKSSIETGRIAHAYLFSGPRGCGKTSAARILARSLNCEKGPTATPCGVCTNCIEIARGASLDVIEIDGASNTSVNDVRQIKDEVLFPPNSGRYKVYIIDEVHMLSNSAFNALLKTIEEPPPYIVFIFATTELHKVPATIKSRCQQFAFRLIPIDTIKNILADACREMNITAEDEALFWIAKESTGSLRDAYTLFDQVVAFSDGHIRTELIREKLGLVGLDAINSLAESCVQEKAAEALLQLDAILEQGVSIEQLVIDMAEYFRSILLLKQGIRREALLGYSAERFSSTVVESLSAPQIEQALSILLGVYRDIRYSLSPRFELEAAISKLCWLKRWIATAELKDMVENLRSNLLNPHNGVSPQPAAAKIAPAAAVREAPEPQIKKNLAEEGSGQSLTEGFKQFLAAKANEQKKEEPQQQDKKQTPPISRHGLEEKENGPLNQQKTARPLEAGQLEEIRRELIGQLKKERGMLASGLEKTADWKLETQEGLDPQLIIPARDSLTGDLLKKEKHSISGALHRMGYTNLQIDIQLMVSKETSAGVQGDENQVPAEVELVRKLFRGTIVRIK